MRINCITPSVRSANYDQKNNEAPKKFLNNPQTQAVLKTPTAAQFMSYNPAFCGGYSLNLADTVAHLDKLAQRHSGLYPPNIREWAGMVLEEGNRANETLIGVHKKLYENIKNCYNLKELKSKFPEFKEVKPVFDIDYREGTLVDDFVKGNLEFFNPEEDLSLQIIKLYWGEGFSLTDLKAYTGGKDLNALMNKLNIPKVNRHYGQVLKLSDPEYNERLTRQMTQKRLESMDIKAQQREGEPVYIKSRKHGPLSAEHKKHISEGLIKFYIENPERAYALSVRQKQYFAENPDQAQLFHKVMDKAWGVAGMDKIKNALSRFMKGKGVGFNDELLSCPEKLSNENQSLIKKFYATNEWARKRLSSSMNYAWKKVKEEQDTFYYVDITPQVFKQKFFKWCEKEGINTTDLSFDNFKYYPHKPELNQFEAGKLNFYTPKFIDSCPGDESQKLANTYLLSLMQFGKHLKSVETSQTLTSDTKRLVNSLRKELFETLFDTDRFICGSPMIRNFDANEVQEIYVETMKKLMNVHNKKLVNKMVELLNESYNTLDKKWKAGEAMAVPPDTYKFGL